VIGVDAGGDVGRRPVPRSGPLDIGSAIGSGSGIGSGRATSPAHRSAPTARAGRWPVILPGALR